MREILFRAKLNYGNVGEWVIGLIAQPHVTENGIVTSYYFTELKENGISSQKTVSADTVGQYTGLTDKNGKKIFEGDICKDSLGVIFDVEWDETNGRFLGIAVNKKVSGNMFGNKVITYIAKEPRVEVIGNIHDNPELLKGGAE